MIKKVTFNQYKALRKMHNIKILTANDTEATILIIVGGK